MIENKQETCVCHTGDTPVYSISDGTRGVFINDTGEMLCVIDNNVLRFNVQYCPVCGKKFEQYTVN